MIRRIDSSLPTFKAIEFVDGFNVVLADVSPESDDRQTRNRAGKSSLVEIVHFLLGGSCGTDCLFRHDALSASTFEMDLDLAGVRTNVKRSGDTKRYVEVARSAPLPVTPETSDQQSDALKYTNKKWASALGHIVFGLAIEPDKRGGAEPTFRSMFPYFARREANGGFRSPEKHHLRQERGEFQKALSYLLGLDWRLAVEWEQVRQKEKALKSLKDSVRHGVLEGVLPNADELYTELVVAQDRLQARKDNLSAYRVLPEYEKVQEEANALQVDIRRLRNDNAVDRALQVEISDARTAEESPNLDDVEALYREVGVALPGVAVRRFEEVRRFHEAVTKNRELYLAEEEEEARRRILERERRLDVLESRLRPLLETLQTAGALAGYNALQADVARAEAQVELLRERREVAETLESGKADLKLERVQLAQQLRVSLRENDEARKAAISMFSELSASLYETPGELNITATENGPSFDVRIQGERSKGVANMQVFCFDMMLAALTQERGMSPGFLIHDSHLFDGVDERQVRSALKVGAKYAERHGFQYVVLLNSDDAPKADSEFDIEGHVRARLTDAREDGGLFGFRFA